MDGRRAAYLMRRKSNENGRGAFKPTQERPSRKPVGPIVGHLDATEALLQIRPTDEGEFAPAIQRKDANRPDEAIRVIAKAHSKNDRRV